MSTASETIASKIIKRLVEGGLMSEADAERIRSSLADGSLRQEDWKLPLEPRVEKAKEQ